MPIAYCLFHSPLLVAITPMMQERTVRIRLLTITAPTALPKGRPTPMVLPACMLVTTNT